MERLKLIFYRICYVLMGYEKDLIKITEVYESISQYQKAIDLLQYSLDKKEFTPDKKYTLLFRLAYLQLASGDIDQAINNYKKLLVFALANDFIPDRIVGNLIDAYNQKKEFNNASKLFEAHIDYLNIEPANDFIYFNIGNTFLGLKMYKNAIRMFESFLQNQHPYDYQVKFNLGLCYHHMNEEEMALSHFEEAYKGAKSDNEKGDSLYSIGLIYYKKKRYKEAGDFFLQAIKYGNILAKEALVALNEIDE